MSSSDEQPQTTTITKQKIGRSPKRGPLTITQQYRKITSEQKSHKNIITEAALRRKIQAILENIVATGHGDIARIDTFRISKKTVYLLRVVLENELVKLYDDSYKLASTFQPSRKTLNGADIAARLRVSRNVFVPKNQVAAV